MVENIVAYETAVLDRICAVCIDRKDDGDCGLDPALECSIKQHLPASGTASAISAIRGIRTGPATCGSTSIAASIVTWRW